MAALVGEEIAKLSIAKKISKVVLTKGATNITEK